MINKNKKSLGIFFSVLSFIFLAGCSNRNSNNGFLTSKLIEFGGGVQSIFSDSLAVYGFMFVAVLFGSFALYKALLRFAFRKTDQFKNKEINVIAFMISIMSTAGIAFIFSGSPKLFILLFGGSAGLLFVLFIVFFIMRIFYEFAENIKDEDGFWGKGPGFIFLILLGALFSSYLLLGYSGKVLSEYGCNVDNLKDITRASTNSNQIISCNETGSGIFVWIWNVGLDVLGWLFFLLLILGIWWFIGRKKDGEEEDEKKDIGSASKWFGSKDKKERSDEEKSEIKKTQEIMKNMASGMEKVNKAYSRKQEILEQLNRNIVAARNSNDSDSEEHY